MRSSNTNEELEPVIVMARAIDPVDRKGGMRLNAEMKGQVVKKALAHAFDKRTAMLLTEEQALTRAFWLHSFGKAKLGHAKALGLPFVRENTDAYGNKEPSGVPLKWNVGGQHVQMRTQMPLPMRIDHTKYFTITDDVLVARCREWQDASTKLTEDACKVHNTLSGMLSNISTYASLEKNWPEGLPFYKHLPKAFPFRHQVPAVLISELNAALGV